MLRRHRLLILHSNRLNHIYTADMYSTLLWNSTETKRESIKHVTFDPRCLASITSADICTSTSTANDGYNCFKSSYTSTVNYSVKSTYYLLLTNYICYYGNLQAVNNKCLRSYNSNDVIAFNFLNAFRSSPHCCRRKNSLSVSNLDLVHSVSTIPSRVASKLVILVERVKVKVKKDERQRLKLVEIRTAHLADKSVERDWKSYGKNSMKCNFRYHIFVQNSCSVHNIILFAYTRLRHFLCPKVTNFRGAW